MPDEAHAETEELLAEIEAEVQREYRKAAAEMQTKLTDYQRRFGVKNKIKLKELREDKITPKEYSEWYKGQVLIGQRWIDMRDQLAADMTHSNEIAMSTISGYLPEVYAINHNYATFDIERQSRINTSYALYNRYTVERLIKDKPNLLPRPGVRVTKDMLYNKQVLTSSVLQTVLQGEDIYKLAKRLRPEVAEKATAEYFGVHTAEALEHKLNVAAMRTARTMVTSAQNGGRYQAYKRAEKMGIEFDYKTWVATLDSRTRDSHARLHGEERPMDEEFSNGLMYPGDENGDPSEVWNCRCCMNQRVKKAQKIDLISDFTGKYAGLSRDYIGGEDMTYQDWLDLHSEDKEVKKAAREKWKVSDIGNERKKRYYP